MSKLSGMDIAQRKLLDSSRTSGKIIFNGSALVNIFSVSEFNVAAPFAQ